MNRENKRKTFAEGYYKTHVCRDSFTCKVCGRLSTPHSAGSEHIHPTRLHHAYLRRFQKNFRVSSYFFKKLWKNSRFCGINKRLIFRSVDISFFEVLYG